MPQVSKFSTEKIEAIMADMIAVLEKYDADRQLALIVFGNLLSNLFEHQYAAEERATMASEFSRILLKSIRVDEE